VASVNEVIAALPLDWPWFERFDNIFFSTAKINGILNAIDQGVHVMNFEIEVMNVSGDEDVFGATMTLMSIEMQWMKT
jgi:hypothetical protein